jgi:hypothetical protein
LALEIFGSDERLTRKAASRTNGKTRPKGTIKTGRKRNSAEDGGRIAEESEVPLLKRKAGSIGACPQDRQVVRVLNHGEVVIVFGTNAVSTIGESRTDANTWKHCVIKSEKRRKIVGLFAENCLPKMWDSRRSLCSNKLTWKKMASRTLSSNDIINSSYVHVGNYQVQFH